MGAENTHMKQKNTKESTPPPPVKCGLKESVFLWCVRMNVGGVGNYVCEGGGWWGRRSGENKIKGIIISVVVYVHECVFWWCWCVCGGCVCDKGRRHSVVSVGEVCM